MSKIKQPNPIKKLKLKCSECNRRARNFFEAKPYCKYCTPSKFKEQPRDRGRISTW